MVDKADVNNEDLADRGMVTPGENARGQGMVEMLRQALEPGYLLTDSLPDTPGFTYLNGNQYPKSPGHPLRDSAPGIPRLGGQPRRLLRRG